MTTETPSRPNVLLDCDPGHDDAIALVFAAAATNLVGITTVAGNAPLSMTTTNARAIAELFGIDVPIGAGADRPLLVPPKHAPEIHGPTGLGGTHLPAPVRPLDPKIAANLILEASHRHEDLWIVAVGPLTNVALALRLDPSLADRLAGISIMGGALGAGNVTPAAEFNLYFDPHAARIVFESGIPLQMCGLDLTHQFMVAPSVGRELKSRAADSGERATARAGFLSDVIDYFADRYQHVSGGAMEGPMHDPCAVLALTHPELLSSERLEVRIEVEGPNRGMTLADLRGYPGVATPNVLVHRSIRSADALELLTDVLASMCARPTT